MDAFFVCRSLDTDEGLIMYSAIEYWNYVSEVAHTPNQHHSGF